MPEDPPPPQARHELRWLGVVVVALVAQYLLVTGNLGSGTSKIIEHVTGSGSTSKIIEPASVKFEAAVNEREINEQQRHSAALFQQYAQQRPLADIDEVEVPQPDEVRESMAAVAASSHELKCGQKIPAESLVVTRGVEIFVKSKYRGGGGGGGGHSWSYVVEFKNVGVDTVQMLTRHWIFTDATGKVTEMKGPGARGVTPVLRPGDSWQYESGTSLGTSSGAMHGSFQLETLRSVSGAMPSMFSARVGRLALSPRDGLELAPCGEAATGLLPETSVRATRRVIVGASVRPVQTTSDPAAGVFRWAYDVQINNARDLDVTVIAHRWVTLDADGTESVQEQGTGVGGQFKQRTHKLPAGDAFRTRGLLTTATPTANAFGTYTVKAQTASGGEVEVGVRDPGLADGGPWPCEEDGCPSPTVSCALLAKEAACAHPFASIWEHAPPSIASLMVWEACPASCSARGAPKGAHMEFEAEIGTIGLSIDGLPVADLRAAP